jgi:hypothetical protein
MRTKSLLPAALLLLLAAGPAAAQTYPLELEFGYRFLNINGNFDEYRSQINEREGFLIRNITWGTSDLGGTGLVDHFRVDGSELGIGPAGSFRLEAGRARIYNLRFSYRRAEAFSALTDFANPLFPSVIPGQHTYSRVRSVYDADLEILPWSFITPILGYTRNEYSGPGQTTYTIGQDEFRLSQDLSNRDEEFRLGAAFDAGFVNGRFIQGWRRFRETEDLTLAPGAGNGNNSFPLLGVNVTANSINRTTETKTDTPSTLALVTGRIGSRIRLIGSYQRAHGEADTTEAENASGSFVDFFTIRRFFGGLAETASTKSNATFWTGGGRAEFAIADGVDFSAGFSRRHRYMDGFALVSSLYTQTTTFAGGDPRSLLVLLQANNAMDRFDNVFDSNLSFRALGRFSLRAGFAQTKQDVTVTPDLSEILVPGNQGGEFGRRVNTYTGGASYAAQGITLAVDYTGDRANNAIVRTDYLDRDRYRFRLAWSSEEFLRIGFNGQKTTASNDDPGIGYDARVWEYGGDLEFIPAKAVHLRVAASKYLAHSSIPVRNPEDFSTFVSDHREDGFSIEGGASLFLGPVKLEGGYSRFTNGGSYPFKIDRVRVNGDVPVTDKFAFIAEWLRDKYNDTEQNTGGLGRYDANRYGFYVRVRP